MKTSEKDSRVAFRRFAARSLGASRTRSCAEAIMKARASVTEFIALVDEKLDHVLTHPGSWGGTETLEPIVLVLSMLRARAANPAVTDQDVLKAYHTFLARRVGRGNGDLRSRLGSNYSIDTMVQVLQDFTKHEIVRERS